MKNIQIISSLYTGKSLTVVFLEAGKVVTRILESSHLNWQGVIKAYKAKDWNKLVQLIDVASAINKTFNGKFTVKNGAVYHGNEIVHGYLFGKILEFFKGGLPIQNLLNFAQKLYQNPSERARKELYSFLEKRNYSIDSDGNVIAYKGVQDNYYSVHGNTNCKVIKGKVDSYGKILNTVGSVIEVDRTQVDQNPNNHCSVGLHAGSRKFSSGFAPRLMVIRFSPTDVVSVPSDHDAQKIRVSRYEVIGEELNKDAKEDCQAPKQYVQKKGPKRDANGRFC